MLWRTVRLSLCFVLVFFFPPSFSLALTGDTGLQSLNEYWEGSTSSAVNVFSFHKRPTAPKMAVDEITFTCREGNCSHYYDRCDLHIHYHAELHEEAPLPASTVTTCHASIEYRTAGGDVLLGEGERVSRQRTLVSSPVDDGLLSLDFRFSYYESVVEAKLTAVRCRTDRVDSQGHWPAGPE